MAAPTDAQVEREASAFRPDRRPFLFGLAANLLLAFVFIGLPYTRARLRAHDARMAFTEFAACFLGGEAVPEPGLALPAGEREAFAHQVMHADADWPARCDAALTAIAPTQATFLFPSVKQADADTRATIDLLRRESKVLRGPARMQLGHVPSRPLMAFSRLRGALAMLLEAAGDAEAIDRNALTLHDAHGVLIASRVPLSAASGATLHMQSEGNVLQAHALDQRGLSWVRVEAGKVDRHRPKRARLLRALTFAPDPLLVWALSEDRCRSLEHGCVHRAMGAARLASVGPTLPLPQWLTAHPPGRPERHVRVHDDALWVTALDEGAAQREVRVFQLTPTTDADAEPTGATQLWTLGSTPIADSLLLPSAPPTLVAASVNGAEAQIALHRFETASAPLPLATLPGAAPALLSCATAHATWIAAFTDAAAVLIKRDEAGAVTTTSLGAGTPWPFHPDDPLRDRVKLLCNEEHVIATVHDTANRTLHAQACGHDLQCTERKAVVDEVTSFDVLLRGDDLIVATAGDAKRAQIRVRRFNALLLPLGTAMVPVPCWDPAEGMCGQPALIQDEDRILLGAREQSDLLVIESRDNGAHWQSMTGLNVSDGPEADGAIMDIHRDRKRYSH